MSLPLIVLIFVFLGIIVRQIFRIPLKIWQIMVGGAFIVLISGSISISDAMRAVDWNIIFFLLGMFILGQAIEESGYLSKFVLKHLGGNCSYLKITFVVVVGMAFLSTIFMNDTIAIIGTPIVLKIAQYKKIKPQSLLLGLAFAINLGSVMSPIGNPQNLFITLGAPIDNPFLVFLKYLCLPTIINIIILYFIIYYLLEKENCIKINNKDYIIYNRNLAKFCIVSVIMVLIMIGYNIGSSFLKLKSIPLPYIALIPAIFLIIFAPKRKECLKKLDWHTLYFFIGMFILMHSVWETSALKGYMMHASTQPIGILGISTLVSQLISNVPLVALYLPILKSTSDLATSYMTLVAGSTIAGNFLIFGAASNLIIVQNAEKRGEKGISFIQFALYGIPLTIISLLIYWIYLTYVPKAFA